MDRTRHPLRRRLLVVALAAVVALVVSRLRAPIGRHGDVLPSIGGDTWPPVPVKDVAAA